jgi:hypothetical protein
MLASRSYRFAPRERATVIHVLECCMGFGRGLKTVGMRKYWYSFRKSNSVSQTIQTHIYCFNTELSLLLTRTFIQLSRCVFVFRTNAKIQSTNIFGKMCYGRSRTLYEYFISVELKKLRYSFCSVSLLPLARHRLLQLLSVCIVSCLTTDDVSSYYYYSIFIAFNLYSFFVYVLLSCSLFSMPRSLFSIILFPSLSSSLFSVLHTDSEVHLASYPVGKPVWRRGRIPPPWTYES